MPESGSAPPDADHEPANPLEMRAALGFALLFVAMLIASHQRGAPSSRNYSVADSIALSAGEIQNENE